MGDSNSQLWLTYAVTDDDVEKALTLCVSMKKAMTTRKLAVLVSNKISASLRKALHLGFDLLFPIEEEWNTAGLSDEEFAKLFALTLKSFEKIVVLDPTMLVNS